MMRAVRLAGGLTLAIAGAIVSGLISAALVMVLVLAAGGGRYLADLARDARSDIAGTYWMWLTGLFSSGMGESWSGIALERYVADAGKTCGFVLLVLLLSAGASAWMTWRDHRAGRLSRLSSGRGVASLSMAPTVFWAALAIVLVDTILIMVLGPFDISLARWLLPHGALLPRYLAAAIVLAVSSGVIWDMRSAMANEVERIMEEEYIAVARANGLDVRSRLLRNLAVPVATRVAGKLPLLLGEVIVVEYFFVLDGAGRQLIGMVEDRDAFALMTVTTFFVAVTTGARLAVSLLARGLLPGAGAQGDWRT